MEAERRQVTILFADMVDFTTFSEQSGEEAAFTTMRHLSKLMDAAVRAQGGIVQAFTGDGIVAVFGTPIAFEDAPLRACRAALSILQQLGGHLDLTLKQNTVSDRIYGSVSTPERRWSGTYRKGSMQLLRFLVTR